MGWKEGKKLVDDALDSLIFDEKEFDDVEQYLERVEEALSFLKKNEQSVRKM